MASLRAQLEADIKDLQADHQEHTEQWEARKEAVNEALEEEKAARAKKEELQKAFDEALDEEKAAKAKTRRARKALKEVDAAREKIAQTIQNKEDELARASTAQEGAEGAADAAKGADQGSEEARSPSAAGSGDASGSAAPAAKKRRVAFPSWGTGRIYSDSAKYWEPATHGWVQGYPHRDDARHVQRFVLHFDSGNCSHTCISKSTFDFLGLKRTANECGSATIVGVNSQTSQCPLYEIRFSVDVVDKASGDLEKIFARTVTAAVIKTGSTPGEVGHFDLLVSAKDTRKFTDLEVEGKKFHFDVLASPPATLYDNLALNTRARFSAEVPQRPAAQDQDVWRRFFRDSSLFRDAPPPWARPGVRQAAPEHHANWVAAA